MTVHGYENDGSSWVAAGGEHTRPPSLVEFLRARIAEDEQEVRDARYDPADHWWLPDCAAPARLLAECEAKRRILELHESWPVLVEEPPKVEQTAAPGDLMMRLTQRIAWLTQQEYRQRFGDEPPTTPMLRALALPYSDHPDYRQEWKS